MRQCMFGTRFPCAYAMQTQDPTSVGVCCFRSPAPVTAVQLSLDRSGIKGPLSECIQRSHATPPRRSHAAHKALAETDISHHAFPSSYRCAHERDSLWRRDDSSTA